MGSHSFCDTCPKCGGDNFMCSTETRSLHISGDCCDCGYAIYTKETRMKLKELNDMREDFSLPLLKQRKKQDN